MPLAVERKQAPCMVEFNMVADCSKQVLYFAIIRRCIAHSVGRDDWVANLLNHAAPSSVSATSPPVTS